MQSDFFDKKVREAADHHHPAYHEDAWKKMRKLLDEHMPEEDDRRKRYFFLIPLFLLLGGGVWLISSQPWRTKATPAATTETVKDIPPVATKPVGPSKEQPPSSTGENGENKTQEPNSNPDESVVNGTTAPSVANSPSPGDPKRRNMRPAVITKVSKALVKQDEADEENKRPAREPEPLTAIEPAHTNEPVEKMVTEKKEEVRPEDVTNKPEQKEESKDSKQKKPGRKPMSLASRFFFFGSAGPDISFTSTSEMGQTRMVLGAGAGFKLNDRLAIRSGFFSARKVYSAKPEDYDPPPQFWNYYPNMQKIDADCKVYEVPLLLSYQFGKGSSPSWFATAGISSYFMKKEKYTYYYKPTPTSAIYKRDYTINNRFEHHFSVVTLSAGYQRSLGKRVTIMAEPYFKLPVTGIGFGKVKLNSGGVLFSIGVRPFGK